MGHEVPVDGDEDHVDKTGDEGQEAERWEELLGEGCPFREGGVFRLWFAHCCSISLFVVVAVWWYVRCGVEEQEKR